MSANLSDTNPNNALMRLGDQDVACRVEGGFVRRVTRKIRLNYGPELYAATPGTPPNSAKVTMYQPGYMKYVAAAGGMLVCPPAIYDVATKQTVANPVVEFVPGTTVIRSVKATAVSVIRDAVGNLHAAVQTITVDAELQFRQAILKNERADFWELLSTEDMQADKDAGKLRGKVCRPFMEGYWLVADLKAPAVREALQTYNNLGATIRQRACSKAERLACDHNPVTRMTWLYGELWQDIFNPKNGAVERRVVEDGVPAGWEKAGPAYVELEVTGWSESRGQAAINEMVAALASQQQVEGIGSVVVGSSVDADDDGQDDDPEDAPPVRQIAENPVPPVVIQAPKSDPVPVAAQAPVVTPKVEAPASVAQAPASPQEVSPDVLKLQERIASLISQLPANEVKFCRTKSGFGDQEVSACMDIGLLRRLQTELVAAQKALS